MVRGNLSRDDGPGTRVPILKALQGPIDGIVSATPDYEKRTVSVTYDTTKLAIKNIEFVIAGVGFDANDIPAKPEARKALPAECR